MAGSQPPAAADRAALILVDFQNDFADENGTLSVPEAQAIIPLCNRLLAGRKWALRIASMDWHPEGHVSFASAHKDKKVLDFVTSTRNGRDSQHAVWPDHCIQNSWGSKMHPGIDASHINKYVLKVTEEQKGSAGAYIQGYDKNAESYSAFANCFDETESDILQMLQTSDISHVVIIGLATDYCIKTTAIDAVRFFGKPVYVVKEAIKGVSTGTSEQALTDMQNQGIHLVSVSDPSVQKYL